MAKYTDFEKEIKKYLEQKYKISEDNPKANILFDIACTFGINDGLGCIEDYYSYMSVLIRN